jgi:hypothetical protein
LRAVSVPGINNLRALFGGLLKVYAQQDFSLVQVRKAIKIRDALPRIPQFPADPEERNLHVNATAEDGTRVRLMQ